MIHTLIRFAAPAEMQQVSEGIVLANETNWSQTHNSSSQGFCFFKPNDTHYMQFADMLELNRCSIRGRKLYVCTVDDQKPLAKAVLKKSLGRYFEVYPDGEGGQIAVKEFCTTVLCAALFKEVVEYDIDYDNSLQWFVTSLPKRII